MTLLSPDELIQLFSDEIETETIYTSDISNVHSIYSALIGKSVENAYVSKVGDITDIDQHFKAANSAVHSEEYGQIDLTNSYVMTDGLAADAISAYDEGYTSLNNINVLVRNNNSYGIFSALVSSITAENVSLYTLEKDSPALYVNNASLNITDSSIGTAKSNVVQMVKGKNLTIKNTKIWNNATDLPVFDISTNIGESGNTIELEGLTFENSSPLMNITGHSDFLDTISIKDTTILTPEIIPIDPNEESEEVEEIKYSSNITDGIVKIILDNCTFTEGNFMNLVNSTVTIDADKSDLAGNIIGDDDSIIDITIGKSHKFNGAVNNKNAKVKLLAKAVWELTEDTIVHELDLDYTSIIRKNGHSLLVDNEDYTEGIVVGSVVHYTTKAEKVYDREILEKNCIVIKKTTTAGDNSEFILYDADDHLAYRAVYSEFRDTGKVVPIEPILQEIEDLLIDIDEYFSNTTIRTKDENTNAILIDGKVYNLDNIIVEKYNDAADEERGYAGENAAIRIINDGELTLTNSDIVADGWIAHGIYVDHSTLNMDYTRLSIQNSDSIGIEAINDSVVHLTGVSVTTSSKDSEPLLVSLGAFVESEDCTFTSNGESFAAAITNGNINNASTGYIDHKSTFNSNDTFIIHLFATNGTTLSATFDESHINTSETNEDIYALIKAGGGGIENEINLHLEGAHLINPPNSETYIYVDPVTLNLYTDGNSVFRQLNTENGIFLKVEYGSIVNYYTGGLTINERIYVDNISTLNLNLQSSMFLGYFNHEVEEGTINVVMRNSTWVLHGDDYISSLDIDRTSNINLNGYILYVDGKIYNPETEVPDDYQEQNLTLGKVLKVLTSNDFSQIPMEERQENYIYFLYDKLEMWFRSSRFISPFCIIEKLPDESVIVPDVLYITFDGELYVYSDYVITKVGHVEEVYVEDEEDDSEPDDQGESEEPIEPNPETDEEEDDENSDTIYGADSDNPEDEDEEVKPVIRKIVIDPNQLAILRAAGTTYFYYAETKYIDKQTKTIIVPYQNGSYQICVNIPDDLQITEDTVIFYNTETNQWEIDGTLYASHSDFPRYSGKIIPGNSTTVFTTIKNNIIKSDLRINPLPSNLVNETSNGILVDSTRLITTEQYETLTNTLNQYMAISDKYLIELRDAVLRVSGSVTANTITDMVHNALLEYSSTIDDMFNNYNELRQKVIDIGNNIDDTFDVDLEAAKQSIIDYINNINNAWTTFEEDDPKEIESDEILMKRAAALDYARQKLLEIIPNPETILFVDELPDAGFQNNVYVIWDDSELVYRIYSYTTDWQPYSPTSATPAPPSDIETRYNISNVMSINQNTNTIVKELDATIGTTYITPNGHKYYFTGSEFTEIEG